MSSPRPPATAFAPEPRSNVRRALAWSLGGNLVIRAASLLTGVIAARLIAPEQFGVFAVALTVWTLLGQIAEFGLGADLVRRSDFERYVPTTATLGLGLSAVLAMTMFLAAPQIANGFGNSGAVGTIRVMAVPLFLIGLPIVPAAILQRQFRQAAIIRIDFTALVINATVMALLAFHGAGPVSLAYGQLAGQLVTILLQFRAARVRPRFGWDQEVARDSMTFGSALAAANLLSWALLTVDNLVVARTTSPELLGYYALAFNVASWPMSVAGRAVRVIALPAFSRLHDPQARARALVNVSGPLWSISALVGVGLMFLAPQTITVLYGSRWLPALSALVPLAAFGIVRVMFDVIATYLIAVGRSRDVLVVQAIWMTVLVPAMVVGVHRSGLAGAGWAHVIVGVFVVLPAYLICLHIVQVPVFPFLRRWIWPTVTLVPLGVALWCIRTWIPVDVLAMLAAALAGVVMYVVPFGRRWSRAVSAEGLNVE